MTTPMTAAQIRWHRELHASAPFGERDRLGTVNHIDEAARLRGVSSVKLGRTVSLARHLQADPKSSDDRPGRPNYSLEVIEMTSETQAEDDAGDGVVTIPINASRDVLEVECHGLGFTHLDGLNHLGLDGTWYGGWPVEEEGGPAVIDWSAAGIVTRGIYANIPTLRGTAWAEEDDPVEGSEIEAALAATDVHPENGDALLLNMGRTAFEAAGRKFGTSAESPLRPGLGASGAEWIADHHISVVCWDFGDAVGPKDPMYFTHFLIWSVGLALVDNVSFSAMESLAPTPTSGALVLAPPPLDRGTGCIINPLFIY